MYRLIYTLSMCQQILYCSSHFNFSMCMYVIVSHKLSVESFC